ncbi:DUF5107 domain-containing protein [Paenibacillus nasutitermitis]|uniref:DUF5107 domain-containing protein n=1 Tax=Paenibacillus nasutitermitis TaxID=1652958 RepID=A0A917E203_9BACL|nr:DUF5107 domain-containing protein [Paenibacillus nasutitermitis]GGD96712.1 hypothetical protein GCM10010911_64360 [Paenibacillus nasutitermitis]
MSIAVIRDKICSGNRTIILENERLSVIIIPELGGKIWQITYKPKNKPLLWNNPELRPGKVAFGEQFEEVFFGGWDELFPNDMAEVLNGKAQPDHGEVWSLPWAFRVDDSSAEITVHMWVTAPISNCKVEKWVTLKSGASKLGLRYKITNLSDTDQPFLFKLHPALMTDEHCRVDHGARTMVMENLGQLRGGIRSGPYEWPYLPADNGQTQDMRLCLPPSTKVKEIQYSKEMDAGWCSVTNTRDGVGFGLAFDPAFFKTLWVFTSCGGWGEQQQMVILEPCTGYPMSVNSGIERGTHQLLKAGQSMETGLVAVVYEGLGSVGAIDSNGNVYE